MKLPTKLVARLVCQKGSHARNNCAPYVKSYLNFAYDKEVGMDQCGHLIASQLGGKTVSYSYKSKDGEYNIGLVWNAIPMLTSLNVGGAYRKWERDIASRCKEESVGHTLDIQWDIDYDPNGRPTDIKVKTSSGDSITFDNRATSYWKNRASKCIKMLTSTRNSLINIRHKSLTAFAPRKRTNKGNTRVRISNTDQKQKDIKQGTPAPKNKKK